MSIPSQGGGPPVEVSLISQMGIGSGDALIASAMARQRGHGAYIDALDEPYLRCASAATHGISSCRP